MNPVPAREPTAVTLDLDGVELNVLVAGEGEPVLLLHGFPDSAQLWRKITPALTAAGYQVIAPDQRGFGRSAAPQGVRHYTIKQIVRDAIAVLDRLQIERAKLVGHDWGAVIGWSLAGAHGHRFERYAALSVGHPRAYAAAGLEQKLKAWYVLAFQLPGLAETVFGAADFALFRAFMGGHPELDHWIADLKRPGRLTAALNWYRANFPKLVSPGFPRVQIPVMGVWSERDQALAEDQMVNSAAYVDGPFRYERLARIGHWMPLDAPDPLAALLLDFFGSSQN